MVFATLSPIQMNPRAQGTQDEWGWAKPHLWVVWFLCSLHCVLFTKSLSPQESRIRPQFHKIPFSWCIFCSENSKYFKRYESSAHVPLWPCKKEPEDTYQECLTCEALVLAHHSERHPAWWMKLPGRNYVHFCLTLFPQNDPALKGIA